MGDIGTEGLPDWRDDSSGGLVRGALWLLQVVGIGNVFTKGQLREAFPDMAQIDRRIRDLRDWGWVIDTSREDASLEQSEQRFVKPGIGVWDPAERKKRARATSASRRQTMAASAGVTCEVCGRAADSLPQGSRIHVTHRTALADGGRDDFLNRRSLCSDCQAAGESGDGASELATRASALSIRERTRLLTWITMGERPRTPVEDIWARYQQLSSVDQQQLARHLALLLNEDTHAEDATS
ncbi:HNH endonuclease [Streptomyces sp. NPDC050738]|uniref:HNH endonuclease n=1 Tax=Streptomyces sp. NPDC050738 TaxID=3154744 RepID=UPI0034465FD9